MSRMLRLASSRLVLVSAMAILAGCSGSDQSGDGPDGGAAAESHATPPPAAIVGKGTSADQAQPEMEMPEEGTARWLAFEIVKQQQTPMSAVDPNKDLKISAERIERERHQRARKIIDLATEAIAMTHANPKQEEEFTFAIKSLMEARMELALSGDVDEVENMFADAEMVYERAPESKAAAEAAYVIVRFSHSKAREFAAKEPRWLEEFSRRARQFATTFPHDEAGQRAVSLLYAAGWSCETHGMISEAISCYTLIQEKFPQSPQAKQVVAVLRRLALEGEPLELAGATIDGGYLSIDEFAGRVVLVAFWSSDNSKFQRQLPLITAAARKFSEKDFSVLGIALDKDESALDAFLVEQELTWPQIFHPDPRKRRWDNPVVSYYGIRNVPMLWLVDANGIVVDNNVDPARIESQVRELLASTRRRSQE